MTMRETRLGMLDKAEGRHWSNAECWCHARHPAGAEGMVLVAPPWDETRDLEYPWPTAGSS
jgi:hypothetical protein